MISQTVEYALRAVVAIAQHHGAPCTAQELSVMTQVPAPYLSKLLQGLVHSGLVNSRRGLHGGFVLTKEPSKVSIWEVVEAVAPIKRIRECPLGIKNHGADLCLLHRRLDTAMALVEECFRDTTVAELLGQPDGVTPLCATQQGRAIDTKRTPKTKAKKRKN